MSVFLGLLAVCLGGQESGAANDVAKLQGTWECVETRQKGKAVEKYVGVRAVIKGNELGWTSPTISASVRARRT